ncbi:MAG: LCP family protein [Acutalibacteraceae bacterium]
MTVFIMIISLTIGFVTAKLDMFIPNAGEDDLQNIQNSDNIDKIYEDGEPEIIPAIESASSYNDYIYKWANNGAALRSSRNVINVLLIGLDSEDALEKGGRSDTIILASLNKKTKKIYLTSFYRDTWTYMNVSKGPNYNKINASYMYGGADALIDTLEKNFKIDIDYYVAVDFSSFTDIINSLGGITVEVEEYEAKYINRTTVHTIDYGPAVTLDGYEALVYARIRHSDSDSDVSRTRRQRKVITAFIDSAKDASLSQLNSALNSLFKYVKTDLTKMQILSYGAQAIANGWANYDIEQITINDPSMFVTGYVGNSAVVFSDFPAVSEVVQMGIYGNTSVVNSDDRIKPFNMLSYRSSDGQYVMN